MLCTVTGGWPNRDSAVPYLKYLTNVDPGDPAVTTRDPLERPAGQVSVPDTLQEVILIRIDRREAGNAA